MNLTVSSIIGGVNEHNSIVNNVCAHDWTADRPIIASNGGIQEWGKCLHLHLVGVWNIVQVRMLHRNIITVNGVP